MPLTNITVVNIIKTPSGFREVEITYNSYKKLEEYITFLTVSPNLSYFQVSPELFINTGEVVLAYVKTAKNKVLSNKYSLLVTFPGLEVEINFVGKQYFNRAKETLEEFIDSGSVVIRQEKDLPLFIKLQNSGIIKLSFETKEES